MSDQTFLPAAELWPWRWAEQQQSWVRYMSISPFAQRAFGALPEKAGIFVTKEYFDHEFPDESPNEFLLNACVLRIKKDSPNPTDRAVCAALRYHKYGQDDVLLDMARQEKAQRVPEEPTT